MGSHLRFPLENNRAHWRLSYLIWNKASSFYCYPHFINQLLHDLRLMTEVVPSVWPKSVDQSHLVVSLSVCPTVNVSVLNSQILIYYIQNCNIRWLVTHLHFILICIDFTESSSDHRCMHYALQSLHALLIICIRAIKQASLEIGVEVVNQSVSLLLTGLFSHCDMA